MTAQQALLAHYVGTYPDDVARQLDELPGDEIGALLMAIDPDTATALLPHLAPAQAARSIAGLELERAAPCSVTCRWTSRRPCCGASIRPQRHACWVRSLSIVRRRCAPC